MSTEFQFFDLAVSNMEHPRIVEDSLNSLKKAVTDGWDTVGVVLTYTMGYTDYAKLLMRRYHCIHDRAINSCEICQFDNQTRQIMR
jgi:phosphoribosylaminoimidazole carboxylase (NCAIR synthetase)